MKHIATFCLAAAFPFLSTAADIWIRFSELTNGAIYRVNDTFTSGGVSCEIEQFQWSNEQWYTNGAARVQSGGYGSVGSEPPFLSFGNANVRLDFGVATDIRLQYGAFGGNQNLRVNGTLTNFNLMGSLDGAVLGGVELTVNTSTNGRGELRLEGIIEDFAIGGQEFNIDDICVSPYIGPKFRAITVRPSGQVTLVFSYPGTDTSDLVLEHTESLAPDPTWMVNSNAVIVSTSEGWFEAVTTPQFGMNQMFYRIKQSAP